MKNIIYSISIALAAALPLGGCSEFLDTVPDERTQLDKVDKVEALLVSAYPQRSFAALVHYRCDNITDFGMTQTGGQPISLVQFAGEEFTWSESIQPNGNDTEEAFWTACYEAVAHANHALHALDDLPETEGRAARGEAHMARAFSHFYLVSLFSELYNPATAALHPGIPYVTEPEERPIVTYRRETVADTYEKIDQDIQAGMPLMTDGAGFHAPKYHFGIASACAFATRFYLLKGDYGNVIKYANMVFPVPSQFDDILTSAGTALKNADGTPVKNVSPADNAIAFAAGNFHPFISSYTSMSTATGIMGAYASSSTAANLLQSEQFTSLGLLNYRYYSRFGLSLNDARSMLFADSGTSGGDWIFLGCFYGSDMLFLPKLDYDLYKSSVSATSGIPYSVMPLLRMEELLLNRAEAYVMTDDFDKAIADMNVYLSQRIVRDATSDSGRVYDPKNFYLSRDRALEATISDRTVNGFINQYNDTASWPEIKKALVILLLRYRNLEFWQEGLRWYDIRRWNIPVKHTLASGASNTLAPGDGRRVLQIPESALLSGVEKNERQNVDDVWN